MQTCFADAHVAGTQSFLLHLHTCGYVLSSSLPNSYLFSSHLPFPPSPSLCLFCPSGSEDLEIRGLPQRVCRSSQAKKTQHVFRKMMLILWGCVSTRKMHGDLQTEKH